MSIDDYLDQGAQEHYYGTQEDQMYTMQIEERNIELKTKLSVIELYLDMLEQKTESITMDICIDVCGEEIQLEYATADEESVSEYMKKVYKENEKWIN